MSEEKNETTGGSSARMEPGTERAGIKRQRRPIQDGKITGDLEKLRKQAFSVADYLGHETRVWRYEEGTDCIELECQRCRKRAGVALAPMAGRDKINGTIVEERCTIVEERCE